MKNSVDNVLPDGEAVLGIMSRKFGADELPLITAVLNRLFVLMVIFLLNPPAISMILNKPIWPAMLCRWRRVVDVDELCDASELMVFWRYFDQVIYAWFLILFCFFVFINNCKWNGNRLFRFWSPGAEKC